MTALHPALTLAWRPLLDPLDAHGWWYLLLLPISFFLAVGYKAVRVKSLAGYWQAVLVMTAQVVLGMMALAAAFYLFVQVYSRWLGG